MGKDGLKEYLIIVGIVYVMTIVKWIMKNENNDTMG